jgi:5-amino-6-(5-phosphoribosylamino)uracil reductase
MEGDGLRVTIRPYVLLSAAMSLDGCIDDTSSERLLLSNAADFDRVDQVRSEVDAILIGAGTMRADNPRLIVKSADRRAARIARGEPEYPMKVTVTKSGNLPSDLNFWHSGGRKVAYTVDSSYDDLTAMLAGLADVVSLGAEIDFGALLDNLGDLGVRRLMVEGGSSIHTAFLSTGLADEIQLAIAPVVVGESGAPRFLQPALYLQSPTSRMELADACKIDDVVLLRYFPKSLH